MRQPGLWHQTVELVRRLTQIVIVIRPHLGMAEHQSNVWHVVFRQTKYSFNLLGVK